MVEWLTHLFFLLPVQFTTTHGEDQTNKNTIMELSSPDQTAANKRSRKSFHKLVKYKFYKDQGPNNSTITTETIRRKFAERTSSQGITHVAAAPGGCKKILWILLSLVTFTMLAMHLYHVLHNYFKFETTTEMKVVPSRSLKFPAVTICNSNAVRKHLPMPEQIYSPVMRDDEFDEKADVEAMMEQGNFQGHMKEDLIVKASFDNHWLDLSEFELFVNPTYGNCYTFNKKNNRSTRRSLPGYGVELLLNIESYLYEEELYYRPVEWEGAVIKIHDPLVEPTPEEGGILVKPGTLSRLAMTKTEMQRLGGKYSDCLRDDEKHPLTFYGGKYTKANCDNTCLQREVISKCCCYLKTFKRDLMSFNESWSAEDEIQKELADEYRWDVCKRDNVTSCFDDNLCWHIIWNRYDSGELRCDECKDLCSKTMYDVSTSTVNWPSYNYLVTLDIELRELDYLRNVIRNITGLDRDDFIRYNLLKVQIYFDHMTVTKVSEQPAVNDFEFASELGGTFGLWVGWTVLTVFEFLEFLMDMVAMRLINKPAQ